MKNYERHPLSAEYPDIGGFAWDNYVANLKAHGIVNGRKVTLYEGKVVDGWQLYRACQEVGITPEFRELKLPKGMTVEEWVETANDHRRHESIDQVKKRAADRRDRVAAARREGESTRAIAEAEGVSETQVRRDLADASSGAPPGAPERNTTGKDGKIYPPKKSAILCERCQRVGARAGCNQCKEARKEAKKPRPKVKQTDALKDIFGNEIPSRCRDAYADTWIQETLDFLLLTAEAVRKRRLATGMDKRKARYPFFKAQDFIDGVGMIDNTLEQLCEHMKENRPRGVCPACEGEACPKCKESGLVPRAVYQKLKEAAK